MALWCLVCRCSYCPSCVIFALSSYNFQVIHHLLSISALLYAMLIGEGQLYTFMVLISESTTPGINLRWYHDSFLILDFFKHFFFKTD